MINKADWRQTVQTVLTLIQNVDAFNAAAATPCKQFRLNPLEMLLVLDVLRSIHDEQWVDKDPEIEVVMVQIRAAMERYTEYTLWVGKLPGRNLITVIQRVARVSTDFTQHRTRHGNEKV